MSALFTFGRFLSELGKWKFLALYASGGAFGSFVSYFAKWIFRGNYRRLFLTY